MVDELLECCLFYVNMECTIEYCGAEYNGDKTSVVFLGFWQNRAWEHNTIRLARFPFAAENSMRLSRRSLVTAWAGRFREFSLNSPAALHLRGSRASASRKS